MKQGIFMRMVALYMFFGLVFSGCISVPNSPTPRFYMLKTAIDNQACQKFNITSNVIIGLGPVKIPEYQNRPQIVTQNKDRMLTFAEFDRWGEPLDLAVARIINENLIVMLPGVNLQSYPWNLVIPVRYQVIMDVTQLESELDKDLLFTAQWSILDLENKGIVFTKRSEFRQQIKPDNYSGLADTLSLACASLSSEIAEALASLVNQSKLKLNLSVSKEKKADPRE